MSHHARSDIRSLAIVAHVDHGKTTLVDGLLWQSQILADDPEARDRLLGAVDVDREKGITVMAQTTTLRHGDARIQIVDAPGHADLGGVVARTLKMVDGVMLVVDACEGPLPQTRFVLRKALEAGLAPLVVMTKIDLSDARPADVLQEVRELFVDLDATEAQQGFPVLYCDARRGICRRQPDGPDEPLITVLDQILETVPAPSYDDEMPLQLLVTHLDYDDFLGRLAIGRVFNGHLAAGQTVAHCRLDGTVATGKVSGLLGHDGLRRVSVSEAGPGEIVVVTGVEAVRIGETLSEPEREQPMTPVPADEPTLCVDLSVNDSPMAGLDGEYVSEGKLRERLWKEILTNVSVRVEETESADTFRVSGPGELQLAILFEMMRREGYEFQVGKPRILTREAKGVVEEPVELVVLDCPEGFVGIVTEKLGARRGRMTKMVNHGSGRVRMEFRVPSRGLIGFRSEFLNDTRGTGIMNHLFDAFEPWQGEIAQRSTGALVADRPGRATAHAIEHLQPRGTIFVEQGAQVYEGMIVGENSRPEDLNIDITKDKRASAIYPVATEQGGRLIPPRSLSLELALEFIREDELLELTPRAFRLRKRELSASARGRE